MIAVHDVRDFLLDRLEARLGLGQVRRLGPSLLGESSGDLLLEHGQPFLREEIVFDRLQQPRFDELAQNLDGVAADQQAREQVFGAAPRAGIGMQNGADGGALFMNVALSRPHTFPQGVVDDTELGSRGNNPLAPISEDARRAFGVGVLLVSRAIPDVLACVERIGEVIMEIGTAELSASLADTFA